ncbi:MAG: LysR family transcriptional regulator [Myxococcales bacterium]|nr:MAG: LysR family transcriptional regulator [Myxococcales bacterium]
MDDLPETAELLVFVAVVEGRSLSKAAKDLGLPRSTVGRRLQRLEERLGVRLLKRSTRKQSLTDAGTEFFQHARGAVESLTRARAALTQPSDRVQGRVRLSVPTGMAASLGGALAAFAALHPAVLLEVDASNQHVDMSHFDVAFRAGSSNEEPNLISRKVRTSPVRAVASPEYLQRAGTPRKVADLRKHDCLTPFVRGESPRRQWPRLRGASVPVRARFASNDMYLLASMARAGLGIALMPLTLIEVELRARTLVTVLPKQIGMEATIHLVFRDRELMTPAVRSLIEHLARDSSRVPQLGVV